MKKEELNNLRETFIQLQAKRDEILEIKNKIAELEKTEEVKQYLELQKSLEEMAIKRKGIFDIYTDKEMITIALGNTDITPDKEIYVYLGTYKYNNECDIIHGSDDIPVFRNCMDADYVLYQDIESKYLEVKIPYEKANEFEKTHKIIIPPSVISGTKYFYNIQFEYFKTMILESPKVAKRKINKLIKK